MNDFRGHVLTFAYNEAGLIESVTDGVATVLFSYSGGRLVSVTAADGAVTTYSYTVTDPLFGGLMTARTLPEGNTPYTQTYDALGRVIAQTDAYGNTYTLAYEPGRTEVTAPDGSTMAHTHDDGGRLTSFTDEAGGTANIDYDADGRRTGVTDRLGGTNTVAHEAVGHNPALLSFADGSSASISYTPHTVDGITFTDIEQITFPDGSQDVRIHDGAGNVLSHTGRTGATAAYTYGDAGLLASVTNAVGGTFEFSHAFDYTLASLEDPAGNLITFDYDHADRVTAVNYFGSGSIFHDYDAAGRLTATMDEAGNTTLYDYDGNGNLVSVTDPLGAATAYSYDLMDRLVMVTDALGSTASRTYDAMGRVATATGRDGATLVYTYDARGNLAQVTGPEGYDWRYTHDAEGSVLTERDPLGNVRQIERDPLGQITKITSPRLAATTITVDAISRPVGLRDPLGNEIELEYDDNSRLVRAAQLGAANPELLLTRDGLGNVIEERDPAGGVWESIYDTQGRLERERDPLGAETAYEYNTRNLISRVTFPGGLGTLDQTYTPDGMIAQKSFSDGTVIDFGYDAARQPVTATGVTLAWDARGDLVDSNGIVIARDGAGRIATVTYAPGKGVEYAYDARGRLTSVSDWAGGGATFAYDAAGRRTAITRSNGTVTTFVHDADGAVTGITDALEGTTLLSHALVRDLKGNVARATRTGMLAAAPADGEETATFDAAARDNAATHDALGRVTARGDWAYTWDLAGRMTSYVHGVETVSFTYDGFGHMVARTEGADTTAYTWNYAMQFPALSVEDRGAGGTTYYVYAPRGALLYAIDAGSGARLFHHFDEAGNTVALTNDAGAVTDRYVYSPFGEVIGREGSSGNLFTWQGEIGHIDEDGTGLYLMRARWYEAGRGRFLSRDPARRSNLPVENNPYGYARANPVNFIDPRGTRAKVIGTGIHTDIEVDIWDGNQVIGKLQMGFYPKVYKNQSSTCEVLAAGPQAVLSPWGAKSIFKTTVNLGGGVSDTAAATDVVLNEGREADLRLAREMLKGLGYDPGDGDVAETFRKLLREKGGGRKSFTTYLDASSYGGYQVFTQVCNDFTDDMLDVYYGYNWYFGPIWFGNGWTGHDNGLIQDLKAHEERMKNLSRGIGGTLSKLLSPDNVAAALDLVNQIPLPW